MSGFFFAADLHLQPTAWVGRQSLRGDSYFALQQILELMRQYQKPVILGGDVFDSDRPDSESARVFSDFCRDVKESGLAAYYVRGNHDDAVPGWAGILGAEHVVGPRIIGDIPVYGLDYTPRSRLGYELQQVPQDAVFICHQAWKELQGGAHFDGSLEDCPAMVTLAGDLHMTLERTLSGGRRAYSPGSTCMQSIDEPESKFVAYCDYNPEGGVIAVSWVGIKSRGVRRFKAMTVEDLDAVCVALQGWTDVTPGVPLDLQKQIVAVEYDPALPRVAERLQFAAAEKVHLFMIARPRAGSDVAVEISTRTGVTAMEAFSEVAQTAAPQDADALVELLRAAAAGASQAEAMLADRRKVFLDSRSSSTVVV